MAGANLLLKKSTAGCLVAGADLLWEKNTVAGNHQNRTEWLSRVFLCDSINVKWFSITYVPLITMLKKCMSLFRSAASSALVVCFSDALREPALPERLLSTGPWI